MLTCGIIGLPTVGKTTLFNLLTQANAETSRVFSGKAKSNRAIATIPDARIDFLSRMFQPRKTTYAQIEMLDVPGLVRGSSQGKGVGNAFLDGIRKADALVHIVRGFRNQDVPHVDGNLDPLRDLETVHLELILADLEVVENRLNRLAKSKKLSPENQVELRALERIRDCLEREEPAANVVLSPEENGLLRGFGLLSSKPMLVVVNVNEEDIKTGHAAESLKEACLQKGMAPPLEISCNLEMEINQLPEADRKDLLDEYGIAEPGISRLARQVYDQLGLISFFTVGEDEVRAWTIERDTDAKKAAGKIHSDLEKGFIKAEVVKYEDLVKLDSLAKVKEKGLYRLEGKDYLVQDSDIINFRFNV